MELPQGFVNLNQPYQNPNGRVVSVMGVVCDLLSPTQSSTGDWMLTLSLLDPELALHSAQYKGIKVRFFRQTQRTLPDVKSVGDVVLLRGVKASSFSTAPLLVSYKDSPGAIVFPVTGIPDECDKQALVNGHEIEHLRPSGMKPPSLAEQMYAISLKKETAPYIAGRTIQLPDPSKAVASHEQGGKFKLLCDVTINKFYDLVVEVVKFFPTNYGYVELYVTDYTENKGLYDYKEDETNNESGFDGDVFGYSKKFAPGGSRKWPGPWGQRVIKIEAMEPHASFIRSNIKEGGIILLQNVRVKLSRQADVEGNLYEDSLYPDRVLVRHVGNPDNKKLQELLDRKNQYWQGVKKRKAPKSGDNAAPQKSKVADDDAQTESKKKRRRKKQNPKKKEVMKKKEEEQRKIGSKRETKTVKGMKQGHGGLPGSDTDSSSESDSESETETGAQQETNPFVVCKAREDLELSTLAYALSDARTYNGPSGDVGYACRPCKVRARVIDFAPPSIKNFVQKRSWSDDAEDEESYMDVDPPSSQQWGWSFALLLEDASTTTRPTQQKKRVWVHVDNYDAEFLLDLEANDIQINESGVDVLREKLGLLWGNLEERKLKAQAKGEPYPPGADDGSAVDVGLSNLPFECYIQETGRKVDADDDAETGGAGFVRIYELFDTTVK